MNTMPHPLITEWLALVRGGARGGLVTDIDGTISPIAPTPDQAVVTDAARAALTTIAERIALVAAISGRTPEDAHDRVGIASMVYIGNHGLERWHNGQIEALPAATDARPAIARVIEAIRPHLLPGMILEDKRVTLSVHYRGVAEADMPTVLATFIPQARALVDAAGLRLFEGKRLIEIRPDLPVHKGVALAGLIDDYDLDAVLFIGDDVTDSDAMRIASQMRADGLCYAVGIGVMSGDDTPEEVQVSADMFVSGVGGVEALLALLASDLSASST